VARALPILFLAFSLCLYKVDAARLFNSPRPELNGNTWRQLRAIGRGQPIACKIAIGVNHGVVLSAAMSQSSGLKAADDEICNWVKQKWSFKPKDSGSFALPIVLHPHRALVTTPGEPAPLFRAALRIDTSRAARISALDGMRVVTGADGSWSPESRRGQDQSCQLTTCEELDCRPGIAEGPGG
jgi:hypothetical protein